MTAQRRTPLPHRRSTGHLARGNLFCPGRTPHSPHTSDRNKHCSASASGEPVSLLVPDLAIRETTTTRYCIYLALEINIRYCPVLYGPGQDSRHCDTWRSGPALNTQM